MPRPVLTLVTYQARPGSEEELAGVLRTHVARLRELGLVADKPHFAAARTDSTGAFVETFWWAHDLLGWAYEGKGELTEAVAEFQKARQLETIIAEPLASLGRAYALTGKADEARKVLSELNEASKRNHVPPYYFAAIFAALGDKDRAIASLEKAYQERSWYIDWLAVDPQLDNLRGDPHFQDLRRRVGLPQ